MKNLKKVLSLVLALAMALSLMTAAFAADASDYKDYSKVTYKEAVDVMTAAGIFNGGDGNNFNPDATLNREQAAKIITYMLVGQEKADKLTATIAPYADVAANRWSAGAIAYCTDAGIIAGDGNGRFNPTAPVLGTQFAKMLLVALGYDPKIEKLVGNEWAIKTAKLALSDDVDLDNGMEKLSLSDNLTREQAAQMAFNAMKATLVEYEDKGGDIIIGDITINNGATKATPVTSKVKADATSISDEKTADGYYTVEFAEKYCKDLKVSTKSADQVDSFGRPATTWVYDGDTVGTYGDEADDSIVLNKSIDAQKAIVTDSDYMNYSEDDVASKIAVYVNGDKQSATSYKALADLDLQAGDEIEVFMNDDNEIETIAVLRYSLAQIDEIETGLSSTYTKQGATCSITLQGLDETGIGSTYYDRYDNDSDKELAGYTPDYEEGTVLAVALKGGDGSVVLDSYVAESHSGKITKYNNGSKAKVTVDGTELPLHAVIATSTTSNQDASKIDFNLDDSTYAVYTDKNGYVIGIDESESVKIEDVYYVTGVGKDGGVYSDSYLAQAVSLADGSVTEFKLKDDSNHKTTQALYDNNKTLKDNFTANDGKMDTRPAGLYTFDKDGGKYIAEKYDGDGSYYIVSNNNKATAISDKLNKDDNKMTLDGAKVTLDGKEKANTGKIYLNDKTNYVKVEDNGDDIDVKFVTGGTSVAQDGTTAIAIATKSGSNYVASYVVLINQKFSNAGSEDVVYVPEKSTTTVSYTNSDGDKKTGYATELYFLDGSGKTETVTVVGQKTPGFYTYEINDDEVYELDTKGVDALSLKAAYDDETGYVKDTHVTGVYNNSMTIDNVSNQKVEDVDFADNVIIADDRDQDVRDNDLYTSEITSASQLKSAVEKKTSKGAANSVEADVYFDDGKVIMVYVKSMTDADGSNGSQKPENADKTASVTATLQSDKTVKVVAVCNDVKTWTLNDPTVEFTVTNKTSGVNYTTSAKVTTEFDKNSGTFTFDKIPGLTVSATGNYTVDVVITFKGDNGIAYTIGGSGNFANL